jgi:hypothetical protein
MMRIAVFLGSTIALLGASGAVAAETLRYLLTTSDGHKAGEQVVERGDDGRTRVRCIFKNNGRGPELEEQFRLAADGSFLHYEVKGHAERGTVIDPTLATFDFIKQRDGEVSEPYRAVMRRLPANVQRGFLSGGMKIPDDATAARYRASFERMVEFVGRAYRAGIPVVAGTDAMAGLTLHSELELYVKAGLMPSQALQIATLNGAKYTATSHERGSIEVSKLANLVLIACDPTRDIAELRKVALVITQGKLIRPADVYESMGIKPFVQRMPELKTRTVITARATVSSPPVAAADVANPKHRP